MAIDNSTPRTRRAILAGGIAAAAAASLGRAQPAAAGIVYVQLGTPNSAVSQTGITNNATNGPAFAAYASGSGHGVDANSPTGTAVYADSGSSTAPAVIGRSAGDNTGLQGYSGSAVAPASPAKTGVYGYAAQDAGSVGVRGTAPSGRGGIFKGDAAPLKLVASSSVTHPASGQRGDLFVDKSGRLWFCKAGTTWKQLA
jgi:hypothetical protein